MKTIITSLVLILLSIACADIGQMSTVQDIIAWMEEQWAAVNDCICTLETTVYLGDKKEYHVLDYKFLKPRWIFSNIIKGDNAGAKALYDPYKQKVFAKRSGILGLFSVSFSPDNKMLITAGSDRILNFIDIKTKKVIYSDKSHPDEIYALDITSDYNYLATACKDGKLRIFRLHFDKQIDFELIKIIIFFIIILIFLFIIFIILKLKKKKSVKNWEI